MSAVQQVMINSFFFNSTPPALGVPGDSARTWGIEIASNNGSLDVDINEFNFLDNVGAAISRSGGTSGATSYYNGTYIPDRAFDGNNSTQWGSQGNPPYPQRLWLIFPSTVAVYGASIRAPAGFAPKSFKFFYASASYTGSGGETYMGPTIPDQTAWGNPETRTFTFS